MSTIQDEHEPDDVEPDPVEALRTAHRDRVEGNPSTEHPVDIARRERTERN